MGVDKMLLSVWPEMGQLLGVSRPKAFQMANMDGFPTLSIGRRKYVPVKALEKWIEENTGKRT